MKLSPESQISFVNVDKKKKNSVPIIVVRVEKSVSHEVMPIQIASNGLGLGRVRLAGKHSSV